MLSTISNSITAAAKSEWDHWLRGRSNSAGSRQDTATISQICSAVNSGGGAAPRSVVEDLFSDRRRQLRQGTRYVVGLEARNQAKQLVLSRCPSHSPLPDGIFVNVQALGDLDAALAVDCRQDDSGSHGDLLRTTRAPNEELERFANPSRRRNLTGPSPSLEHCLPPGAARNWADSSYSELVQMSSFLSTHIPLRTYASGY
jgi:hypothetical protein